MQSKTEAYSGADGSYSVTSYNVFPGIELIYNDMHMSYCNRHQQPAANVMEINYCKEGRSECLFGGQRYCYMSAGDLSFCSCRITRINRSFRPHITTASQ